MHTHRLALLCGGAAFALTPPARRIAAKRTYAVNAAVLPTEACVALLYVAPLPPVGTIIGRRWRRTARGAAVDNGPLVAPPRDKNDSPICATRAGICAACRRTALKVFFFFVALRLSAAALRRPGRGEHAFARDRRHVVGAAAAAAALTVAVRAQNARGPGRAVGLRARVGEECRHALARWIPPVGQGHVFRACYGLALALTVNFG